MCYCNRNHCATGKCEPETRDGDPAWSVCYATPFSSRITALQTPRVLALTLLTMRRSVYFSIGVWISLLISIAVCATRHPALVLISDGRKFAVNMSDWPRRKLHPLFPGRPLVANLEVVALHSTAPRLRSHCSEGASSPLAPAVTGRRPLATPS